MDEEQSARAAIERMIADWDAAFTKGNAYGIVGHCLPNDAHDEDNRRRWNSVMAWTENMAAHSTIKQFRLHDGQATMIVEQRRSFCWRRPLPEFAPLGRAVLSFAATFTFIEREANRLVWTHTRAGWLCMASQRLSYRVRVQRRTA